MKKWFVWLFLQLCGSSFALPIQDHQIDSIALSRLCLALDIPKDGDVITETQKRWLRKPGQERWELAELSPEQKLFVLKWAEEQGLFAPWKPARKKYDKAFILGATTYRMQKRLNYLKKLWVQGIRFNKIVWLTGERPLDQRVDGLIERCSNESEAARILWEETDLPSEMRQLPVVFIAVPMKIEGSSLKRPTTEDTLIAWLKTDPQPCSAFFVSDQPFCGYQFAVVKTCMPESFDFEVVGEGIDAKNLPVAAVILDSVARWIYQDYCHQYGGHDKLK
jgi:hypothetical protein